MEASTNQCTTFDQDVEKIKSLVEEAIGGSDSELFARRLDEGNYRLAGIQLRVYLQMHSAIPIDSIETDWPALGSQQFIDKMSRTVANFYKLKAATEAWEEFLHAHGGVWKLDSNLVALGLI